MLNYTVYEWVGVNSHSMSWQAGIGPGLYQQIVVWDMGINRGTIIIIIIIIIIITIIIIINILIVIIIIIIITIIIINIIIMTPDLVVTSDK